VESESSGMALPLSPRPQRGREGRERGITFIILRGAFGNSRISLLDLRSKLPNDVTRETGEGTAFSFFLSFFLFFSNAILTTEISSGCAREIGSP